MKLGFRDEVKASKVLAMDIIVLFFLFFFFFLILCRILTRTRTKCVCVWKLKSLKEPDSLDSVDCGHRSQKKMVVEHLDLSASSTTSSPDAFASLFLLLLTSASWWTLGFDTLIPPTITCKDSRFIIKIIPKFQAPCF